MRLFFKFLAVFVGLSFNIFSQEDVQYVKVEVASLIWKNQITTESFQEVDEYQLADEVLLLEKVQKPKINLETIKPDENQIKIDASLVETILLPTEEISEETPILKTPKIFRIIDKKEHELNGTMRRISKIEDLELADHKSWYQPLSSEDESPFILVSNGSNQCIVKVFQSRFPRIHAKCAMGPDSLSKTYLMSKAEFNVKPLIGEYDLQINSEEEDKDLKTLYLLDEQRRIKLDEFHYFDHPKLGILVGVYSYPKEE